jgi:Cu+-exporting ATPase
VCGDLRAVADAIRLSRRVLGTIKRKLFWAFAYNLAAIPIDASGYLTRCWPRRRWPSPRCSW